MGTAVMRALRVVIVALLAGTVVIQLGMVAALISGSDPEDGALPLTSRRVITVLGVVSAQVVLVCGDWSRWCDREPASPRTPSGASTA